MNRLVDFVEREFLNDFIRGAGVVHQHHGMFRGIVCHQRKFEFAGFKAIFQLRD